MRVFDFFWKTQRELAAGAVVVQPPSLGGYSVVDIRLRSASGLNVSFSPPVVGLSLCHIGFCLALRFLRWLSFPILVLTIGCCLPSILLFFRASAPFRGPFLLVYLPWFLLLTIHLLFPQSRSSVFVGC